MKATKTTKTTKTAAKANRVTRAKAAPAEKKHRAARVKKAAVSEPVAEIGLSKAERLSAAALKAWATRRAKATAKAAK